MLIFFNIRIRRESEAAPVSKAMRILTVASSTSVAIPFVLGLGGVGVLLAGRRAVRGTTLVGPWWWLLASLLLLVAVEVVAALHPTAAQVPLLRFVAGCSTFCPTISLLGAKRPQDRGWHFVVGSLWIVLALPALQSLLLRPEYAPETHSVRKVFLVLLIAAGLLNGLPTRQWMSACLVAVAQGIWLGEPLGLLTASWSASSGLGALGLYVAGLAAGLRVFRGSRVPRGTYDGLWLDFRDRYGLLWSLRVAEQINASATRYKWDLVLRWRGFRLPDGSKLPDQLPAETDRALRQNLHNLLRRFVSSDWIADRLTSRVH